VVRGAKGSATVMQVGALAEVVHGAAGLRKRGSAGKDTLPNADGKPTTGSLRVVGPIAIGVLPPGEQSGFCPLEP
jgi:hypothetical protein